MKFLDKLRRWSGGASPKQVPSRGRRLRDGPAGLYVEILENRAAPAVADFAGNTLGAALNVGSLNGTQQFYDWVGNSDRDDFYRFSVSGDANFELSLTGLRADADVRLVRDSNGNGLVDRGEVLAISQNGGKYSESIQASLSAGTYFVQVYPYKGKTFYTLTLSASLTTPAPAPAPTFSSVFGYGLVNATAAVAAALGQPLFTAVPDLGGVHWGVDMVQAPEVWARGYTGAGVIVAVVDSGVDYRHPDLDANIWVNTREIPGNGVDDDGNGFVDDVRGWDFVAWDNDPMDLNGHGTHVAGTIAAEHNGLGALGVAYQARVMPVRVLDSRGSGWDSDIADGIRYAVDNGAHVINLSLGGSYSSTIASAVQYAHGRNVVVVMASGNEYADKPTYPARLADRWGIAVGAMDQNNQVADFSNRAGTTPLSYVVAPGVSIYSTTPNNSYASYSGTSMAAPHVAGVAALVLSAAPQLTAASVITILTSTANPNGITA